MPRPRRYCTVGCCPPFNTFTPKGYSSVGTITISPEEVESLRLKNIQNLDQTQAAAKMGISQSTFQRILQRAYKKVSLALIEGRELRITQS